MIIVAFFIIGEQSQISGELNNGAQTKYTVLQGTDSHRVGHAITRPDALILQVNR